MLFLVAWGQQGGESISVRKGTSSLGLPWGCCPWLALVTGSMGPRGELRTVPGGGEAAALQVRKRATTDS